MSEQINAYCTICGNGYHMCLSCKDKMKMSPWKVYTDSAEHYKIHQIIHGLSTKVYTKDEVRSKLKNVDLSDLETFKPNIKQIIQDVLKEENPVVTEDSEPVEHVSVEHVVQVEKTEDVENITKINYSRKRNYKVDNEVTAEE